MRMQISNVGILGATGLVGQDFILKLDGHPIFRVFRLGASDKSVGKVYKDAVKGKWRHSTPVPEYASEITLSACRPELFQGCEVIFSSLLPEFGAEIETEFAAKGFKVFSNASNFRMDDYIPLVVPTANPEHLSCVRAQQKKYSRTGYIVKNANCSTSGLTVVLKALSESFGAIRRVHVVTMQAVSGAGFPGVPSMSIHGNVIPYISKEENKIEEETKKILSTLNPDGTFAYPSMKISAACNRVGVIYGHTECVSVEFENFSASIEQVSAALESYDPLSKYELPSWKHKAIVVHKDEDRPQPALDVTCGNGYTVTVGRIRKCDVMHIKFVLLSHNTVLGAAGSSILNAEIAHKGNYLLS